MSGPARSTPESPSPRIMSLRKVAIALIALLGLELVLGVVLNVSVNLPTGASVATEFAASWVLDLHVVVALLIIGLSGHAVATSGREPERRPRVAAVLTLLSALVATAAGWEFVFNGQSMAAAGVMTLGFLGVLVGAILMHVYGSRGAPGGTAVAPS